MRTAHSGRRRIYTDETSITIKNVRKVVLDALTTHEMNVPDIQLLDKIEKNDQDLVRDKDVRPEINIIATDPIASQIVDFKQGYEHGRPIMYVQRAKVDSENPDGIVKLSEEDDLRIATFNEMMRECKKSSKDSKLSRDIKTYGVGYRYVDIKRKNNGGISPFELYTLNPERTFVIYSNNVFGEPIAAVTFTENATTKDKRFGVWTDDFYYEFYKNDNKTPIKQSANQIGMIPIVEYINNYDIMGSFEKEIPLIDAYNVVTSDRVNDICQQVQSILWLHNTKLDDEQKAQLVDGGVIQTQANADGKDAKIQYVNAPLKQSDVQTLASSLKERILESAGVPKLSEGNNSTGEAMRVTNGWHTAETQAKTSELTWRESEDRMIEVCLQIIKISDVNINDVSSLKLSDLDYDMHRSENYDIVSRVNAFVTLTDRGCDIEKSANYCKITDDPLQFALDSKQNMDKLRFAKLSDNSTTDTEKAENEQNNASDGVNTELDMEKPTESSMKPTTIKF